MKRMSKEAVNKVEERFTQLVERDGIKKGTKGYIKAHNAYFIGAIQTADALEVNPPPIWTICIVSGRDVTEI